MKISRQIAFTLVEVMIACAIFTLILESIYVTLHVGLKSWNTYSNAVLFKQDVRRAMIAMSTELREAKNIFIVKEDNNHGIALNFEKSPEGAISYIWKDSGDEAYEIVRKNNNNTRVLGRHITSLSFDYPVDNQIIIDVAAVKDKNIFDLKEKIVLRLKTDFFNH
jgi:type II secretory pathway component PulJ